MYREFLINRETGRLATLSTPPNLIESKMYVIYPEKAADWVRENNIEQPPTDYDTIGGESQSAGDAAILSLDPFDYIAGDTTIVGNAKGDNFAFYRLSYFPGLSPLNLQAIVGDVGETKDNSELGVWDVSELEGLYTILLTVMRRDGTFDEVSVPVTVDNSPPEARILFPLQDQVFFTDDEWVIVQAGVEDNLSIDRVEFFVDNAGVPFAISTVPPYTEKWTIPGPGCHSYKVVAFDAAGNATTSNTIRACSVDRDG